MTLLFKVMRTKYYYKYYLGLRPAKERHRYKVTLSLIGWAQT